MRYVSLFIVLVLSTTSVSFLQAQPSRSGRSVGQVGSKNEKDPKDVKGPKDDKGPKSVPEPATMLLLGAAAAGYAGVRKLRQRKNAR